MFIIRPHAKIRLGYSPNNWLEQSIATCIYTTLNLQVTGRECLQRTGEAIWSALYIVDIEKPEGNSPKSKQLPVGVKDGSVSKSKLTVY